MSNLSKSGNRFIKEKKIINHFFTMLNTDFDYELSDTCEEDSHIQDVSVPPPKDIDIVLTPATAKKYLVDGEPLPDENKKSQPFNSLENNILGKDECELSDGDFLLSDETLNDHIRGVPVEIGEKEGQLNDNEEYITPPQIKGKFYNMADSVPENVLLRKGEPSFYDRPENDPIRKKVSAFVLAAFAFSSYKTLFPEDLEKYREQFAQKSA